MAEHDPKQFIVNYLSFTPSSAVDQRLAGQNAQKATIRFLKELCLPRRQVHMLTFEDHEGRTWDTVICIDQDDNGGWHEAASSSTHQGKRGIRNSPWVYIVGGGWGNLGNGWGDHFWAGGYLAENAPDAERIRLIFKNGLVLEESVQDDLVLFLTDQKVQVPVQVEVYSHSGELLGVQVAFNYEEYKSAS